MIVGQIAPNTAIVSSADTPFPAIGRTIIASMPASNNRLTCLATSWLFPARSAHRGRTAEC